MSYAEEEYLQLSGIQHFLFCRRQWALIHMEQQWSENYRTIDGDILHRNVHDSDKREKRGNLLIVRAMKISSARLGLSGECGDDYSSILLYVASCLLCTTLDDEVTETTQ